MLVSSFPPSRGGFFLLAASSYRPALCCQCLSKWLSTSQPARTRSGENGRGGPGRSAGAGGALRQPPGLPIGIASKTTRGSVLRRIMQLAVARGAMVRAWSLRDTPGERRGQQAVAGSLAGPDHWMHRRAASLLGLPWQSSRISRRFFYFRRYQNANLETQSEAP